MLASNTYIVHVQGSSVLSVVSPLKHQLEIVVTEMRSSLTFTVNTTYVRSYD